MGVRGRSRRANGDVHEGFNCLEPEPIVIRASGVWNSRSPFNEYFNESRSISKVKSLLSLGAYQLCHMARKETDRSRTLLAFLGHMTKVGGHPAALQVDHYQDQFSRGAPGEKRRPLVTDLLADSTDALQNVQENALVSQSALFERFVQCWFLNMILAKLETEGTSSLSARQKRVLADACPFSRRLFPAITDIIPAFPEVQNLLLRLPRMKSNRKTGKALETEMNPAMSAWAAVEFWREYRNLVVHQGGFVTSRFLQRNYHFFQAALKPHFRRELRAGGRLPMGDNVFGAMATAHYIAAAALNAHLEELSEGRRGHPEAPKPKTTEVWPISPVSPRMLLDGDHELSRRWTTSTEAAHHIASGRGWSLEPLYAPRRYVPTRPASSPTP